MGYLFIDLILYPIGWLYLKIRYQNKTLIKKKLSEDYNDKYSIAGSMVFLKLFGIFFISSVG
jgi:hypothetical protein